MVKNLLSRAIIVSAAGLALAFSAPAQQSAHSATKSSSAKHKTSAPKKKVWTDDNIDSVLTPADRYQEQQEAKIELQDASSKQAVAGNQATSAAQPSKTQPPRLSNPKDVESADNMIAWEDRDIAAQTEFIGRLQQELDAAPASDKPRLQNLLEQKKQLLEQTKAERQGLVDQKKQLQRKAAGPNGSN